MIYGDKQRYNKKIILTYEEYDRIWELCDRIMEAQKEASDDLNESFLPKTSFPTVAQMKEHHVAYHLDKYLPYLMFYYVEDLGLNNEQYKASRKFIKELLDSAIVFQEDIEAQDED